MVAILVTCMCIFVFWSINYKPKYFTKLFFYSITQLKYLARMVILYYHPLSFFVLLETLSVLFFFIYFCCSLSNNLKKKIFFFFLSQELLQCLWSFCLRVNFGALRTTQQIFKVSVNFFGNSQRVKKTGISLSQRRLFKGNLSSGDPCQE